MDAANEVARPSLPLDIVAHNATVILSGVLLALLAFVASHLGLRHRVHLNDRSTQSFHWGRNSLYITFVVYCDSTSCLAIFRASQRLSYGLPEYTAILETIATPTQMTETPT
ncbi:hypothetical protein N7463_004112 [Penicillium fimorum]|uniref:Uncharacterized protein n=1 Tax=Penicillium fimorum TaxID=1882269 RepID=A0A9W9Y3T5_9EURO|nr:hypothetical protein N7463_004112 [Penicillium fimorum]